MMSLLIQDTLFLLFCLVIHLSFRYRKRSLLPFPPGPKRWLIVGNAFEIPLTRPWAYYKDLGNRLGTKLIYLEAFGQSITVINDIKVAQELLEKRSALYSSRPHLRMLTEVVGFEKIFGFMPYGEEWRAHRRMFQQHFSEKHLSLIQEKELEFVRKGLLSNIIKSPYEVREHIKNCIGGFSISITYGLPVRRVHDPLVKFAEAGFAHVGETGSPGNYPVNIIGPLKYVPEWFPGGGFKREAREIRKILEQLMDDPYESTLKTIRDGTAQHSFIADTLDRLTQCRNDDFEVQARYAKQTALGIFGAISESSAVSIMTFVLAMLVRSDVQRKAQEEIDSVIGSEQRLPDFPDIPHLTYLSAIIKEVLRWNPIAPLGVPHKTSQEDMYEGYYIPKDCTVMANAYAMLHDEAIFPNPTLFQPERFLLPQPDGKFHLRADIIDPEYVATFGFGRRACPGSHIARSTLSITAASLLYLFDISPALDDDGNPIEVNPVFTPASLVSEPLPFACKITPRQGRDIDLLMKDYMGDDDI